jgi:hypothetical protein
MKPVVLCAIMAVMWCAGCASTNVVVNSSSVAPITHQPESGSISRNVGLLRRLAVLPARLEFSPSNGRHCVEPCDWEQLTLGIAENVPKYLTEWRGYEVIVLDPMVADHASVELPGMSLDDFAKELAIFAGQRSTDPPKDEISQCLQAITKQLWVDGVVLIQGSVSITSKLEAGLGLALAASGYGLLGALPIQMVRIGSKFEADIFETRTGRLIWASVYSSIGNPFAAPPAARTLMPQLLDPIEAALPITMTRIIPPPRSELME